MAREDCSSQLPTSWEHFSGKRRPPPEPYKLIAGGLAVCFMYVQGLKPLGHWPPVWGILVSGTVFIAVSLATRPPIDTEDFFSSLEGYIRDSFGS
jgi:SSS family solute:Na+ symporter